LEKHLILHCSPTLAGIKTASLFSYTFLSEKALACSLRSVNETLVPRGIRAEVLRIQENNALIFVYRESLLSAALCKNEVDKFLAGYGYSGNSVRQHITRLKSRLASCCAFPHEIGVFLGYPLPDVIGFIENNGRNSKCAGCWKVYCDEYEAVRLFAKFQKCKSVYTRMFLQGRPIERLIVAA